MDQTSRIASTITQCIEQLNKQLPAASRLSTTADTILIGDGGQLDSLGVITLFVNIEQELESKHGLSSALFDTVTSEDSMDSMSTVEKLVQWINENATTD